MCWVALYRSATEAVMVWLKRSAIHTASIPITPKTRQSTRSVTRSTLVIIPLNEAPKSWLYNIEGRDSTLIKTSSRLPVSQSVTGSVEVKPTGRSATLTADGSVPPTILDFPDTVRASIDLESAGFEFAAPETGIPASPFRAGASIFPLTFPDALVCPSFRELPSRSVERLATPNPCAIMSRRELSTGRLVIRLKMRPSFHRCWRTATRYSSFPSSTSPENSPLDSWVAHGGNPKGVL